MEIQEARVLQLVNQTKDLPVIPGAALKLVKKTADDNVSTDEIVRSLTADQALAARVLRLSNSAFYGLPRRVNSLHDAVVVLGLRTVRHLSLLAATFPWLSRALPGYNLSPKTLWRHSFATAMAAEYLAKKTRCADSDQALTSGLLHDFGKIVLSTWMEEELTQAVNKMKAVNIPLYQAEYEVLGLTHADVGGQLAEQWDLPESLVESIRFHHMPQESVSGPSLIDVVHVGNIMASGIEQNSDTETIYALVSPISLKSMEMTETEFESAIDAIREKLHDAASMLEFD